MENRIEVTNNVKKTFLSNKVVESGTFRLMAICTFGIVKYSIEKQLASLGWKSVEKYAKYLNATNRFLAIQ
jgi:hypothetical protein